MGLIYHWIYFEEMVHAKDVNKALRRSCSLSIGGVAKHLFWTSTLWDVGGRVTRRASAENRL